MSSVFMHGIASAVGDKEPISAIDTVARNESLRHALRALGFVSFRRARERPIELAFRCVEETLERSPIARDEIDAVVYASSSIDEPEFYSRDVWRLCERFGLLDATPIGISLAECANFATALRVARNFVLAQECRNVLVVTTDVCLDPDQRVVQDALSILSDGAASCIVSAAHESRFEVLGLSQKSNQLVRTLDPIKQQARFAATTSIGITGVVRDLLQRTRVPFEALRCMITNNINCEAVRFIAVRSGFQPEQCFTDNIAEFAHVHSADNLINLMSYAERCSATDELVLTLSHGFGTWGAYIVRIRQRPDEE